MAMAIDDDLGAACSDCAPRVILGTASAFAVLRGGAADPMIPVTVRVVATRAAIAKAAVVARR